MVEITSDAELRASKALIDEHLQGIQDYLGHHDHAGGKVRFPRGYLRPVGHFYQQLRFVDDKGLRRNLCYALVLSDVLRWIINRTDLWGLPKEMVSKIGIVVMGAICESIAINGTRGLIGRRHAFCARVELMVNHKIITEDLRDELQWLWQKRCAIHIHDVSYLEYGRYNVGDYNRAVRATRDLRKALEAFRDSV